MIDPILKKKQDSQIESPSSSPAAKEAEQIITPTEGAPNAGSNYPDNESEYVPLPSRGIFYKGRFKGLDKLKVRKLNYQDEDILTTKSYYDNETVFNEVLKNTIVDSNGFKAEQLVPVDRDAILMWLRIGAFGKDYVVPHVCENKDCEKKGTRTWDLADFDMPIINSKHEKELTENGEVTFTLPDSAIQVKLTVPSTGREFEVKKMLDDEKRQLKTDRNYAITGRLLTVISCVVDGDKEIRSLKEIREWLNKGAGLSMIDSRYIQKMAKEIDIKINTEKTFTCKHCGTEEVSELVMSIFFFWPDFHDGKI